MSDNTNETPAATTAAPKGVSTETLVDTFKALAEVSRKAMLVALKGGVSASGIMAVTAYKVTMLGGTKAQAHFVLFGTEKPAKTDSGEARMWRAAWALAGFWRFNKALPVTISGANSEDAAFVAASEYLESNGISSIAALEAFVEKKEGDGEETPAKAKASLPERLARTVRKAKKAREFSVIDARQTAQGLIKVMGLANARAFTEAAVAALAELSAKRANNDAKNAALELAKTGTEN